jgi:glycerol 3-phosphatase-2
MFWVFDLDGVIWLSGQAIPGSPEAVARLRQHGHRLAFVSNNSSLTVSQYLDRLGAAGIPAEAGEVVSSAQAAASRMGAGSRVAFIGGDGVREALLSVGAEIVDASDSPDAVVVGRTVTLDFAQLTAAASAVRAGARFVATNSDATFPTAGGLEPGNGALVAFLEVASGRRAEVAGKPEQAMADLLRQRFGSPDAVVGDRPDTDGRFAERLGADFVLVLSGVTRRGDLPVDPAPKVVADDLASAVATMLG